jgi:transglutaminase-like putative cysteine protease
MTRLRIRHESLYTFPRPVTFGAWRLLMRPLDTHATRIVDAWLETPPGEVIWSYDAYGNCVCHLQPDGPATQLKVVNNLIIERYPTPLLQTALGSWEPGGPVVYDRACRRVLEAFISPETEDGDAAYTRWLQSLAPLPYQSPMAFLQQMNAAIHGQLTYAVRFEEGVQGPSETVALGRGTCRDFAWLMIESVRRFGFAARFATGYLYSPGQTIRGAGATHAWCEVFLPRQGWIEFDPTNALVESPHLIRVATTRTWQEADPMNGPVFGPRGELFVAVDVDLLADANRCDVAA